MFFKSKKMRRQDRIAMHIASLYGMTYEYKLARRHHCSPIEALEEWDLMKPEYYEWFEE